MSKTDWSKATPAALAERCAAIQGWEKVEDDEWGYVWKGSLSPLLLPWHKMPILGHSGACGGCYDPANNNDQATALFESEHWPLPFGILRGESDCITIYDDAVPDVVLRVYLNEHPAHPTARAIAEAICVAHEEESDE